MTGSVAAATNTAPMRLAPRGLPPARRRPSGRPQPGPSGPTTSNHGSTSRAQAGLVGDGPGLGVAGVVGEGVGEEQRLHEGERAAPAVERVGAGVGVADGVEAEHGRVGRRRRRSVRTRLSSPPIGRTPPTGLERTVPEELVGPGQEPAGLARSASGSDSAVRSVAVVGAGWPG